MTGVLIIDKPQGWTSHDVVQRARTVLREKRIGHTGTLDPLATGVLVLCIGQATRIVRYLESDDKQYIASFRLGQVTDTQDAEGTILETREYAPPARQDLESVLKEFRGQLSQRPPVFSAIKVHGVPSHRLARKGEAGQLPERRITVHALDLLAYEDPEVRIRVTCSKGTYIRTLCADIGARLGMGAHLTMLRRERAGAFVLEQALSVKDLQELAERGTVPERLLTMNDALGSLPFIRVPADLAGRIAHGNSVISPSGAGSGGDQSATRILDGEGRLIAVGSIRQGFVVPETVLS